MTFAQCFFRIRDVFDNMVECYSIEFCIGVPLSLQVPTLHIQPNASRNRYCFRIKIDTSRIPTNVLHCFEPSSITAANIKEFAANHGPKKPRLRVYRVPSHRE